MKPSRTILEAIARQQLGIPTLEIRRSDRLDFHDVSVWNVEAALKAAFDAGSNVATAAPRLLDALDRCAMLLADYDEQEGEEGDAYREAIASIAAAINVRRDK